jgi:N-acyl-D-aspartate/D-glutamate deacylase
MRWLGVLLLTVAASACDRAPEPSAIEPEQSVDLLIVNGRVLDGQGNAAIAADVLIREGVIVAIQPSGDRAAQVVAERTIDAAGRIVAPGFIDPHSHGEPLETPDFENFLAMGVTTISLGQDGSSPQVASLADYLSEVTANGISVNLAMFVGHGTLRDQVGIGMSPNPDEAQLGMLRKALDEALDVAFGMSSGLEYNPGLHAPPEELNLLAEVVGARDRLIMSHMRNEDDDQLQASLNELIAQGEYARVHVAHLKSVYGKGAARAHEILGWLEAARADGIEISADSYPYSASYTGVALLFPVWAKTAEQFAVAKTTRRQELADYLRQRVLARNGPEATLLGTEPFVGETLADLAARFEMPFEEVLIDVIGPQGSYAAYFVMDDELLSAFLVDPNVSVSSDGSPTGFHPRGHGTFARVIEDYVVKDKLLELPEAIRKMTSLPADQIGMRNRGRLLSGYAADLVIFDPANVRANATYIDPLQFAEGFDVVIVNGQVARESSVLTPGRAGSVLKPGA